MARATRAQFFRVAHSFCVICRGLLQEILPHLGRNPRSLVLSAVSNPVRRSPDLFASRAFLDSAFASPGRNIATDAGASIRITTHSNPNTRPEMQRGVRDRIPSIAYHLLLGEIGGPIRRTRYRLSSLSNALDSPTSLSSSSQNRLLWFFTRV